MKSLILALAMSLSGFAWAQTRVTWSEGEKFAELLLRSKDLKGVSTFGVTPGRPWQSSQCHASVWRPERAQGPQVHPENVIWCELTYGAHEKGMILWQPNDVGFEAWGNSFDVYPFQIMDQPAATALFAMLKEQVEVDPENPWYSTIKLCGPDGSCTESYFINQEPTTDSPGAFAWNLDYLGSQVLKTRCVFLKFK